METKVELATGKTAYHITHLYIVWDKNHSKIRHFPFWIIYDYFFRYTSAKYTLLSFLPLNLMEQCRRMSNLYFIFILILCCFLYYFGSTQVDPKSWALSTLFIFVVTMIKQGYEDFLRHRNDRYFPLIVWFTSLDIYWTQDTKYNLKNQYFWFIEKQTNVP